MVAQTWRGAQGLAADIRYDSQWMHAAFVQRIGRAYPPVVSTDDLGREQPNLAPCRGRTLTGRAGSGLARFTTPTLPSPTLRRR